MEPIAFKSRSGLMPLQPKKKEFACAKCVTCPTKVRTVSNCVVWPAAKMPCAGAKLYLSAGIAFAAPTTWNSIMESKPSTAFAGSSFVPTGGGGGGGHSSAPASAYHHSPSQHLQEPEHEYALSILDPSSFEERPQLTRPSLAAIRKPSDFRCPPLSPPSPSRVRECIRITFRLS